MIRLVGRQALGVAGAGALVGLVLAAGAQVLRLLSYGIEPLDPASFGAAAVLFATACLVSARRAVGINPVDALRSE